MMNQYNVLGFVEDYRQMVAPKRKKTSGEHRIHSLQNEEKRLSGQF